MQITCPPISQQLIDYLEHVFPDRAANPAKDDPMKVYGNAEVVRHLKAVMKTQEEEPDVYLTEQ